MIRSPVSIERDDVDGARFGVHLQCDQELSLTNDANMSRAAHPRKSAAGQCEVSRAVEPGRGQLLPPFSLSMTFSSTVGNSALEK